MSTAQAKCVSGYSWAFNSLNQSPCDVAASLAAVCVGGTFTIAPLAPQHVYQGPSADAADGCRCNTVYYSLIAACSACQERNFVPWSSYTIHCTTVRSQMYPLQIPKDTKVPHYAYLDVVSADNFDIAAARAASGPESTTLPTGTTTPFPTTPTPTGMTTGSSTPNVGAIAGGVVGGVVGLALLGTLLFLFLRRRSPPSPPTSTYDPLMASQIAASLVTSPYPSNPASPSPYVAPPIPGSPPTIPSKHPSPPPTSFDGLQQPYPVTYANQVPTNYIGTSATSGGQVPSRYSGIPRL